jgi:hypothetical protein
VFAFSLIFTVVQARAGLRSQVNDMLAGAKIA